MAVQCFIQLQAPVIQNTTIAATSSEANAVPNTTLIDNSRLLHLNGLNINLKLNAAGVRPALV